MGDNINFFGRSCRVQFLFIYYFLHQILISFSPASVQFDTALQFNYISVQSVRSSTVSPSSSIVNRDDICHCRLPLILFSFYYLLAVIVPGFAV